MKRLLSIFILSFLVAGYLYWLSGGIFASLVGSGVVVVVCLALYFIETIFSSSSNIGSLEKKKKSNSFDWGMHYFRAFAILCIVLVHFFNKMGYREISKSFFDTSTIFFLFISGYLCQFLDLKKKTEPIVYYKKKLLNVVLPYIICTLATVAIVFVCGVHKVYVASPEDLTAIGLIKMFLFGRAQVQYWYIPFIVIVFAFSPLLLRLNNYVIVMVTIVAAVVAVIFPERGRLFSIEYPNCLYLYTYFMIYYLLGFVYARFKDMIDPWLKKYFWIMLITGLIIAVWKHWPEALKLTMVHGDLALGVQKVAFTGVALVLLMKIKDRKIALLDTMAKYSFTYYFLHCLFIQDYINLQTKIAGIIECDMVMPVVNLGLTLMYVAELVIVGCLLKSALGKYSRMFIGS